MELSESWLIVPTSGNSDVLVSGTPVDAPGRSSFSPNWRGRYVAVQRGPSHAVHGTWVDLYLNHLKYDSQNKVFVPDPTFSSVDSRYLEPQAIFVLEATNHYLERYFSKIPECTMLLSRIEDLGKRLFEVGEAHERLMANEA